MCGSVSVCACVRACVLSVCVCVSVCSDSECPFTIDLLLRLHNITHHERKLLVHILRLV